MKRDKHNCMKLLEMSKKDALLSKQITEISHFSLKEQAASAVRLGRMRGLYFSETDWISTMEALSPIRKSA